MANLFLGLDSSTQSLSAILIDLDTRQVIYDISLSYDETFPHYRTENGVLKNANPQVAHTPPLIWVDALDKLFAQMQTDGIALNEIKAISGSGQQHGSVYLNTTAPDVFSHLDANKSLTENLANAFSRDTSPIWMDSSTRPECDEICENLGGLQAT
ncbi:MAG: carbohydrate kinase, partial [Candidatus Latescibacteria bacterium]|nr:carbohydrate kinase [Candidatus Latescibacterota bacterium]